MKKILLVIVACAIIAGLVPAAFATETGAASDAGYEFVFTNAAHTTTAATASGQTCKFEESGRDILHTLDTTDENVSDPWGYVAQSFPNGVINISTETESARLSFKRPGSKANNVVSFNPDDNSQTVTALCFELEVSKGGVYTPVFNYKLYKVGPVVELYLVPKDGSITDGSSLSSFVKNLDAKYRIGIVDSYSITQAVAEPYKMRNVNLSAQNYYFIMVPNGQNETLTQTNTDYYEYFLPISLGLSPVTAPQNYSYDITSNAVSASYDLAALNTEVKSAANDYGVKYTALTGFGSSPSVDVSKTTPWSIAATRYVLNATASGLTYSEMTSDGLRLQMYTARYCDESSGNGYFKDTIVGNETVGNCTHVVLVISIPEAGKYELGLYNNVAHEYGSFTQVAFGKAVNTTLSTSQVTALYNATDTKILGWHDSSTVHNGTANNPAENFVVEVGEAGNYALAFITPNGTWEKNKTTVRSNDVVSTGSSGYQTFNLTKIVLDEVQNSEGDEYINVDPGNVSASVTGAETTPIINAVAADVFGNSIYAELLQTASSVSAPKEISGYEFLYWTKDIGLNKKIVSHNEEYSFVATPGRTIYTAVYREKNAATAEKAVFYNANGDIVGTVDMVDGKVTTPALTSMAGFGNSTGWKLAGSEATYEGNCEVEISGEALFVADYEDLSDNIAVTVVGGEGTGSYSYGDTVTVTAPTRKDGSGTELFNYWEKTVNGKAEIVSFEKEYAFSAWEPCTLTAVYTDYVPVADTVRKILLGSVTNGGETTVVAEFIGFDDAVERGIAFGDNASFASLKRCVMNSKDLNHLAVINDEESRCVAYVITANGEVYYNK
ncbi:MAG: hypothetical protein E7473_02465 [Ruminococcaceae bacterium]|nr:hypothetical protein [Oscillospiraceae bacterium]